MWAVISVQLDDAIDIVAWMPAHTAAGSVGQRCCSDGVILSSDMWCANQIVDMLAKDAARAIRLSFTHRRALYRREHQVRELVIFLGKLTFAASSFELPDGTVIRDSMAVKSFRRVHKGKTKTKPNIVSSFQRVHTSLAWRRGGRSLPLGSESASRKAVVRRAEKGLEAMREAAFQEWWRENRSHQLRPRSPSCPTAAGRMDALKQRVAAKSGCI